MSSVIEISPLTRVEGHGQVKLYLEGSRVERVELCLTESPRLFEALLVGKSYQEVPEIICRICSLCSTVHKVTALLAVEKAFDVSVSEVTRLTRELINCGGTIQSHALHLYCLMLPDMMELSGVSGLALAAPELLKSGLAVKRVGNLIQETVGGRLIHPVNIALGGLGRRIPRGELLLLREAIEGILPTCRDAFQLFQSPFPFPELPACNCLALTPTLPGISGEIFSMTGGRQFPVENYRRHIVESTLPHSHAKFSLALGLEPTVGALSRLNLGPVTTPAAGRVFETVKDGISGADIRGNNLAQAVELCQAAEQALELIAELLELGKEGAGNLPVVPKSGNGSAACEAPRGVLIHSYRFDDAGLCTEADVITPTSLNQGALSRNLLALAQSMDGAEAPQLTTALERLVRCYDPCISCSVHFIHL
jgi:sulfhydrogenase subunit alpha